MNNTTLEKVRLYRMSTPEHECPWGLKAVNLLNEKGIEFIELAAVVQVQEAAR